MPTNYYLEYGGGLGDIFYQMFSQGSYGVLRDMKPKDRATVVLITHNPYVRELFDYHPKAHQLEVKDLGCWLPDQDGVMRKKHGLPQPKPALPVSHLGIEFYPAASDSPVLSELRERRYVIFSASAGLPGRSIPPSLLDALVWQAIACSLLPVFVGKSYQRLGRTEYRSRSRETLDLVDRLTVPAVGRLVQDAAAVVCCHSAVNILAWLLRKPNSCFTRKTSISNIFSTMICGLLEPTSPNVFMRDSKTPALHNLLKSSFNKWRRAGPVSHRPQELALGTRRDL